MMRIRYYVFDSATAPDLRRIAVIRTGLPTDGVIDVLITDADGLHHLPAKFDQLYVAELP